MKGKYRDVVFVDWRDSCSVTSRWIDETEVKRRGATDYRIHSVGFVVQNTKDFLTIGLSVDNQDGHGGDSNWDHCLQIPYDCIQKIRVLSKAVKKKRKK